MYVHLFVTPAIFPGISELIKGGGFVGFGVFFGFFFPSLLQVVVLFF